MVSLYPECFLLFPRTGRPPARPRPRPPAVHVTRMHISLVFHACLTLTVDAGCSVKPPALPPSTESSLGSGPPASFFKKMNNFEKELTYRVPYSSKVHNQRRPSKFSKKNETTRARGVPSAHRAAPILPAA